MLVGRQVQLRGDWEWDSRMAYVSLSFQLAKKQHHCQCCASLALSYLWTLTFQRVLILVRACSLCKQKSLAGGSTFYLAGQSWRAITDACDALLPLLAGAKYKGQVGLFTDHKLANGGNNYQFSEASFALISGSPSNTVQLQLLLTNNSYPGQRVAQHYKFLRVVPVQFWCTAH